MPTRSIVRPQETKRLAPALPSPKKDSNRKHVSSFAPSPSRKRSMPLSAQLIAAPRVVVVVHWICRVKPLFRTSTYLRLLDSPQTTSSPASPQHPQARTNKRLISNFAPPPPPSQSLSPHIAKMSTMPASHGHNEACCNIPPVLSSGYSAKGSYAEVGGLKTCW